MNASGVPARRLAPLLAGGIAILCLAVLGAPGEVAGAKLTAFTGGTVIDGTGGAALADAVLLVEGARIVAIGPRAAVAVPAGALRIDVSSKWLIPGLIDGHVHFFQSGGLYTRPDIIDLRRLRPYGAEIAAIQARLGATLARYVASGVTAVVDVGGPRWSARVRALAEQVPAAPRVALAGPLLATYTPPELAAVDPPIIAIRSAREARAEVRRQLDRGVDLIKVWFVFPKADLAPDLAWVRAAIDEAHAAGARVVVHATQLRVARAVVEAGADILAHGIDDAPLGDGLLEQMRAQGVIYTPTLMVRRRYHAVFGRHLRLTAIERRLGDPESIASLGDLERLSPRLLPVWVRRSQSRSLEPVVAANLRRVQAAGVTVAAGSDAGNIGTLHGPSLHRELELMVEAGLTPMATLVAATRGGAALMGRSADLGTLAPGKLADFVILAASPLADIRNTRRIWRVVEGGKVIDPTAIAATLASATRQ